MILASSSPRRRELLESAGIVPDAIISPDINETRIKHETVLDYVKRMASEKARAVAVSHADACVIAADTIVVVGQRIFDKTDDEATARKHLQFLSGRRHRVYTAVCIIRAGREHARLVETRVAMKRLATQELDAYIASGEWKGKAGAYAIQGRAAAFIPWINGSITNVIGLPLTEVLPLFSRPKS